MRIRALTVSLLAPGAGHALQGRPLRGAVWLGAVWLCVLSSPWTGIVGVGASILAFLGAMIDAAIVDRHETRSSKIVWLFIAGAIAAAIGVRAFYMEAFKIPSGAMLPTIAVGDHIMVAKWRKQPARGDLVVFIYPVDPSKDFIKRVVALAGDQIEVRGGTLYVNGAPATDGAGEPCGLWDYDELRDTWAQKPAVCVPEKLDDRRWVVAQSPRDPAARDLPPTDVPPGHVFVLGDNRHNSQDSRFWGPLPIENIKGKPIFIWWSAGEPEGTRWSRIGRRL